MKPERANAPAAGKRLAERLMGKPLAARFHFELWGEEAGLDAYELIHEGGEVRIRGNSGPALSSGLHHYLSREAGAHFSWQGSHLGRLAELPGFSGTIRQESWARWRYFLNYCCHSYSLAFWQWEEWEVLIDWMALHGINLPLAMTGQEAVWLRVCRRLGLSDQEIRDFLPGAAYLPFGWMGCLDGWTGPLSDHWIEGHEHLGGRILERQRELGMTPVLQGFTGHVPSVLRRLFPEARYQTVRWLEWETTIIDPLTPLFGQIAALYMEEQSALFGTNHFYAADTFIEMIPPSDDPGYLKELAQAVYGGMALHDPDAVWVLQGWPFHYHREFWKPSCLEALLGAVPNEKLLILDLFCESFPVWERTKAFCGKPWLWCNVQNFGRNVVLSGALETNNSGLAAARGNPESGRLEGLGIVNEGLCYNPVAYDFFFEQAWREEPADLAAWGRTYARQRYGTRHSAAEEAWEILATDILARFRFEDSGLVKCPTLPVEAPSRKDAASVERVWGLLLDAAGDLGQEPTFRFDLVHVGRQALSNLGNAHKRKLQEAVAAQDRVGFDREAVVIRGLLADLEALLSEHAEFGLAAWVRAAEAWGSTSEERETLRAGALRQVTLWGNGEESLRDYARKEWAGLLGSYTLPRWEAWFDFVSAALDRGTVPEEAGFRAQILEWERRWPTEAVLRHPAPRDAVAISQLLFEKYSGQW